mmetsp:Transcript_4277/g.11084  ORF Transcript_4277/g.11084 Transcript_4277/m.11084 type:complete len:164 (+) Transcript_4277:126-617(+)
MSGRGHAWGGIGCSGSNDDSDRASSSWSPPLRGTRTVSVCARPSERSSLGEGKPPSSSALSATMARSTASAMASVERTRAVRTARVPPGCCARRARHGRGSAADATAVASAAKGTLLSLSSWLRPRRAQASGGRVSRRGDRDGVTFTLTGTGTGTGTDTGTGR